MPHPLHMLAERAQKQEKKHALSASGGGATQTPPIYPGGTQTPPIYVPGSTQTPPIYVPGGDRPPTFSEAARPGHLPPPPQQDGGRLEALLKAQNMNASTPGPGPSGEPWLRMRDRVLRQPWYVHNQPPPRGVIEAIRSGRAPELLEAIRRDSDLDRYFQPYLQYR